MNRHFTYDSKYFPPAPVVTIKLTVKETNLSATDLTALIDTGADASFAPLSVLESIQAGIGKVYHARSLWGETQSFSSFIVGIQMNGATLPGMVMLGYDGDEVVLGRDVLNRLWLELDGPAQTTSEPTPSIPADARPCSATNLTLGEGTMGGATQHDFVYLPMTHTSRMGCVLQPPVKVQLIDAQGKTLPVDYSPPLETATSPSGEPLKMYLGPGEAAMLRFDWGNWCTPLKQTRLMAKVNLTGDNASWNIPLSFPFFYGHCFSPNARATLFTMSVTRIPR